MIPTTEDETEDQERQDQTNIKFPDNRLLIDLCGEFDKNLAEIEQRLTLQIVRRGNE
ncbi:MAG: phosphate starvation-inducible protein PhoH, partial [Rhodobacteraceae bacterium]|nr:phosphate starvation-inducible protein PhoH [Paracoccaceae bacterium]